MIKLCGSLGLKNADSAPLLTTIGLASSSPMLLNLNIWWLRGFNLDMLWPLLLIAAGAALIWRRMSENQAASSGATPTETTTTNTHTADRS